VDEIGFIEDAIDRAIELAKLDKDDVRVIRFQRPFTIMNLVGLAQANNPGFPLEAVFEMSAPRAYYLATSLPPLVTSRRQ
jgi:protease-4